MPLLKRDIRVKIEKSRLETRMELRSMEIRRVPISIDESNETCPICGHRRGSHHNPDDRCCEDNCNCGFYFYGKR